MKTAAVRRKHRCGETMSKEERAAGVKPATIGTSEASMAQSDGRAFQVLVLRVQVFHLD